MLVIAYQAALDKPRRIVSDLARPSDRGTVEPLQGSTGDTRRTTSRSSTVPRRAQLDHLAISSSPILGSGNGTSYRTT